MNGVIQPLRQLCLHKIIEDKIKTTPQLIIKGYPEDTHLQRSGRDCARPRRRLLRRRGCVLCFVARASRTRSSDARLDPLQDTLTDTVTDTVTDGCGVG